MSKKVQIREEDIQKALKKFQESGGLIKRLPDQINPNRSLVGAKYGVYEAVEDTSTPAEMVG